MAAVYNAIIQEDDDSLKMLTQNHYNLQLAKSVSTPNGKPEYNVVYKSTFLASNMSILWSTVYGLNWVAEIPAEGTTVTYSGKWQECTPGQSFDLSSTGLWAPNNNNPNADKNSLNVGSNDYPQEVHILVGVKNTNTGNWTPIWVGTNALLKKSHGEYRPRQTIKIWFEEGVKTATIITKQGTGFTEYDMSNTPLYYFSYKADPGTWLQPQPTPFPFSL